MISIRLSLSTKHSNEYYHGWPACQGTDKLGMFGQGHMVVDIHGRKCICRGYGCLHAYSSIPAIKKDVINHLKRGHDSVLREKGKDIEEIEFEDICEAVNEGDPLACLVIKDAAQYTGIGLSNFINILYPDLIYWTDLLIQKWIFFMIP